MNHYRGRGGGGGGGGGLLLLVIFVLGKLPYPHCFLWNKIQMLKMDDTISTLVAGYRFSGGQ